MGNRWRNEVRLIRKSAWRLRRRVKNPRSRDEALVGRAAAPLLGSPEAQHNWASLERLVVEVGRRGALEKAGAFVSRDYVMHDSVVGQPVTGRLGFTITYRASGRRCPI